MRTIGRFQAMMAASVVACAGMAWGAVEGGGPYERATAPLAYAATTQPGMTALGGSEKPLVFPAPDPQYLRWEKMWNESRMMEARIARLHYDVAFVRTMEALKLSPQQMGKMLPLARQARTDGRAAVADFVKYFEQVVITKEGFADDIKFEDLVTKHGREVVNGNFDKTYWEGSFAMTHPGGGLPKAPILKARGCGEGLDAILTQEQLQIYADALKQDPTKSDLGYAITGLRGTWITNLNFVPVPYLGTLNTGNSITGFATPSTGLLLAPLAIGYLEGKLGLAASGDPEADKWEEQAARSYWLARLERRVHRRCTVPYNWIKGATFTAAQYQKFAVVSRQMLDMYNAEEVQWQKDVSAYLTRLEKIHETVLGEKPVDEAMLAANRTEAHLTWSYWSGAADAGLCAEDQTFKPRSTGIWKMFPEKTEKLMAEADSALGEGQKIVLWDVHGDCYRPWRVFTNPINAGAPAEGLVENAALTQLRAVAADQATGKIAAMAKAQAADYTKQMQTAKKDVTPAQSKEEEQKWVKFLELTRAMSDTQYELAKTELAYEYANTSGCGYVNNPNGLGTPEQNGQWPRPDWSQKEVKAKWEARLENLLLPELVPFYQARAALMKQYKEPKPADLDGLKATASAEKTVGK